MSILGTVEAVPARVVGVGRYLLMRPQGEERNKVIDMLSPPQLRKDGNVVKPVMSECVGMGLVDEAGEKGEKLAPSSRSLETCGRGAFSAAAMRALLTRLVLDIDNTRNHDFGRLLAWFLAQDGTTFGGGWNVLDGRAVAVFANELQRQSSGHWPDSTNEARLENFNYWAIYLGFAWNCDISRKEDKTLRWLPDPSSYIADALPQLFGEERELPLLEFLQRLAVACPVFEGGYFYKEVAASLPSYSEEQLPPALTFALARLRSKKILSWDRRADAPGRWLAALGGERITHLQWNAASGPKGKKGGA